MEEKHLMNQVRDDVLHQERDEIKFWILKCGRKDPSEKCLYPTDAIWMC
jgi:hypothetical protein